MNLRNESFSSVSPLAAEAGLIGRSTGHEYALKIIDKARCCGKVSWDPSLFLR